MPAKKLALLIFILILLLVTYDALVKSLRGSPYNYTCGKRWRDALADCEPLRCKYEFDCSSK